MTKIFTFTTILILTANIVFAQLKEKDNFLGPSIGFWPDGKALTIGLNFEHQLTQAGIGTISLGAIFRYTTFKDKYIKGDYYEYSWMTLGIQSNYNFNQISDGKFAPFAGLVLGYNSVGKTFVSRSGEVYVARYNSGLWMWAQGGIRYFFSPTVAGAVRIGIGNFNFNTIEIGVDFKL